MRYDLQSQVIGREVAVGGVYQRSDADWYYVRNIWLDACKKVGVTVTMHQGTKHSTAQSYLDDGYSFEQLRVVTGHASIASVKHYASATVEHRRSLLERRVVPLRKREEG